MMDICDTATTSILITYLVLLLLSILLTLAILFWIIIILKCLNIKYENALLPIILPLVVVIALSLVERL